MNQNKMKFLEIGGLAIVLAGVTASLDFGSTCPGLGPDNDRLIHSELMKAFDIYQIKNGTLPPQGNLQTALNSIYEREPTDAWGNPILYLHPEMTGGDIVLISAGQDARFNTADDLITRKSPREARPSKAAPPPPHAHETPDRMIFEGCRRR